VTRGKLGLAFQPITPELAKALSLDAPRGALVAAVEPAGPAAQAGIQPGDVIVGVGGAEIGHAEELPRQVARNAPGTKLGVTVLRDGKKRELTATLGALEDEQPQASSKPDDSAPKSDSRLGLRVSPARGGGVRVEVVAPGSAIEELRAGDVILEVGGQKVGTPADLEAIVARATKGEVLLAKIRRGGATRFAAIPIR
jgi:serine protease Do